MKQKILVFGGSGLVGSKFIELKHNNFEISAPDLNKINLLDKRQVETAIKNSSAEVIINFAAFTNVGEAEKEKNNKEGVVYKLNAECVKDLARICKSYNKFFIHFSTDYIFDGTKSNSPYIETDQPNPVNWYGYTKYIGEQFILESGCKYCIIRISMPYCANFADKKDVARFFIEQIKNNQEITAIDDQYITPTLVDDIAGALSLLVEKKSEGIFHVVAEDSTTPFKFAKKIAEVFDYDINLVKPISFEEFNKGKNYQMLKYSWLDSGKFEQQFPDILHTIAENILLLKNKYS